MMVLVFSFSWHYNTKECNVQQPQLQKHTYCLNKSEYQNKYNKIILYKVG